MDEMRYISVILPLKLEWEPCYCIGTRGEMPDQVGHDESAKIEVGDRVKVRFANHEYVGVVSATDIKPEISPSRVQQIRSIEKGLERILPEEIALWREVAEYYMCSVGEVYKAAYPAMKVNLEEARAAAKQKVQERRERMLESMRSKVRRIRERLARKEEMIAKAKEGTKSGVRYIEEKKRIEEELATATAALENAERHAEQTQTDLTVFSDPAARLELSPAQEKAYKGIIEGFKAGKPVLLNGVTGSGKTEIYIRLAKETIAEGQNVLYLVPEIALSRQLEERLREHFGERMLVFHSGESAASRRNTAETVRESTQGYIVLGTRSSLFLPHHDLGLVIVDEEHDSSYKQDSPAPRYNGRDTALMLSVIQSQANGRPCRVLLGSATPSLEELYNCQAGRHVQVDLTERYHGAQEADIEIIDTKAERRKNGMSGNFSRKLIAHIEEVLGKGGQVMILRSRRAWAPVVQCENCGEIVKCPHCNVSLSLHKKTTDRPEGTLICHYCGYRTAYSTACTRCNGPLKTLGAGTQKIEEEVQRLFPNARIARMDSDSNDTQIIREFAKGNIDILVGTQMLTKGFDFSRLRLVAVIAADSLLGMQDFRADEKAAQILEQFKGRCGRRDEKGLFVIQTSQPEHPVYQNIVQRNSGQYHARLMQERKDFMFPPFARIVELTFRDRFEDRAERMADRLASRLSANEKMQVTGPYAPIVDRQADMHIRTIRISLRKDRNLRSAKTELKVAISKFEKENRYDGHLTVNADPS